MTILRLCSSVRASATSWVRPVMAPCWPRPVISLSFPIWQTATDSTSCEKVKPYLSTPACIARPETCQSCVSSLSWNIFIHCTYCPEKDGQHSKVVISLPALSHSNASVDDPRKQNHKTNGIFCPCLDLERRCPHNDELGLLAIVSCRVSVEVQKSLPRHVIIREFGTNNKG